MLELQSRLGDKTLKFKLICPQNGTAVLKGLQFHVYQPTGRKTDQKSMEGGEFPLAPLFHAGVSPADVDTCMFPSLGPTSVCSYLGLNQPRIEGDEYLQVVDEFVAAVKARWPKVLIQVRATLITTERGFVVRGRCLLYRSELWVDWNVARENDEVRCSTAFNNLWAGICCWFPGVKQTARNATQPKFFTHTLLNSSTAPLLLRFHNSTEAVRTWVMAVSEISTG